MDEDEVEKPKLKPKKDFGNLKKNEGLIELGPNESNVRDRGLIVQGSLVHTSSSFFLVQYLLLADKSI